MRKLFPFLLLGLATLAAAQTPFTPKESQHKKLASRHDEIVKLQSEIVRLQAKGTFLFARFMQECRNIAIENGWPADVQCNFDTEAFFQAPAQQAAALQPHVPAIVGVERQLEEDKQKQEQQKQEQFKAPEPKK